MSGEVTGEEVRAAMLAAGIQTVDHHECSLCGAMVFYSRLEAHLFFHPACNCSYSPPERCSWDDAARWINMQSNPSVRDELKRRFGFTSAGVDDGTGEPGSS